MIEIKELKTIQDFEALKKGDFIACEFHLDVKLPKRTRFSVFKIVENKKRLTEIILQKKNNIYFNYQMFIDGTSNLKSAVIITQNTLK